ncbi:MAG: hypothetical protein WC817_00335 [Patescibacteria group bacterium]|jgi:hypothetical protein
MDDLLNQIQKGLDAKLYYLALFAALAIPDICGALDSENGEASRDKYIAWFDANLKEYYGDEFDGKICYFFRCSFLHQGSSIKQESPYERIFFAEPGYGHSMHNCTFSRTGVSKKVFSLDIDKFCNEMIQACSKWQQKVKDNKLFKKHYENFMKRYPNGLEPYINGIPIIG